MPPGSPRLRCSAGRLFYPVEAFQFEADLRQVVGEFFFIDDEKPISVGLDQPEVTESLHEQTDPRPGRPHHLG